MRNRGEGGYVRLAGAILAAAAVKLGLPSLWGSRKLVSTFGSGKERRCKSELESDCWDMPFPSVHKPTKLEAAERINPS